MSLKKNSRGKELSNDLEVPRVSTREGRDLYIYEAYRSA